MERKKPGLPPPQYTQQIINQPFVRGLADGSLSHEQVHALYRAGLALYRRVLQGAVPYRIKAWTSSTRPTSWAFAADGVAVEKALHESHLLQTKIRPAAMTPACTLYTSVLKAQSYAPVEVGSRRRSALLLGIPEGRRNNLYNACTDSAKPIQGLDRHLCRPRIQASTQRAIDICDELAQTASPQTRAAMTEIFVLCTKMEWLFWDSAWNLEKWKI